MPVRILMLLHSLRVSSGVSTYVMNYYRVIDHEKFHIDFALWKDVPTSYYDEIVTNGSNVHVLPSVRNMGKHVRKCHDILSRGHYDIIHNNSLMITYPMMLLSMYYVDIRILHSHSTKIGETTLKERRNKLFTPFLLKTANQYIACTTQAGNALFGNRSFEVVPNIINVDAFKFNNNARKDVRALYSCTNKIVIGSVGRLTDSKNPFFALDVIRAVAKILPNVEYWWIGSGVLDKQVAEYVKKIGLSERVRLFGSRNDVWKLYQAMDIFFLPSKAEGFGLACLEAQAAGLSCVVSDGFPREVDVTGNVSFIPLEGDITCWIRALVEKVKVPLNRLDGFNLVKKSPYSDNCGENELTTLYLKCLNLN